VFSLAWRWRLRKRSALFRFAKAVRSVADRRVSVVRVKRGWYRSSSSFAVIWASFRTICFSRMPVVDVIPVSLPPWPGSITTTFRVVFIVRASAMQGNTIVRSRAMNNSRDISLVNFLDTFIYKRYLSKLCV